MKEKQSKVVHNFLNREEWIEALNVPPQDSWIKNRKVGGKSIHYIPIAIQQALADFFFHEFDVVDAKFDLIVNELLCTVKISVLPDYPNAEYRTISGSGAKPVQARSGSSAEKFPKGKITNSMEYCAPAARALAISNALSTFANVFGRNVGRDGVSDGYKISRKNDKKRKKQAKTKKAKN